MNKNSVQLAMEDLQNLEKERNQEKEEIKETIKTDSEILEELKKQIEEKHNIVVAQTELIKQIEEKTEEVTKKLEEQVRKFEYELKRVPVCSEATVNEVVNFKISNKMMIFFVSLCVLVCVVAFLAGYHSVGYYLSTYTPQESSSVIQSPTTITSTSYNVVPKEIVKEKKKRRIRTKKTVKSEQLFKTYKKLSDDPMLGFNLDK